MEVSILRCGGVLYRENATPDTRNALCKLILNEKWRFVTLRKRSHRIRENSRKFKRINGSTPGLPDFPLNSAKWEIFFCCSTRSVFPLIFVVLNGELRVFWIPMKDQSQKIRDTKLLQLCRNSYSMQHWLTIL